MPDSGAIVPLVDVVAGTIFDLNTGPTEHGYTPTDRGNRMLKLVDRQVTTATDAAAFLYRFGAQIPPWWPRHVFNDVCQSHWYRVLDEAMGTDLVFPRHPPVSCQQILQDFLGKEMAMLALRHTSPSSANQHNRSDQRQRPFLSVSGDFPASLELHAKGI